jgi:hypothetical protein
MTVEFTNTRKDDRFCGHVDSLWKSARIENKEIVADHGKCLGGKEDFDYTFGKQDLDHLCRWSTLAVRVTGKHIPFTSGSNPP